MEHVISWFGFVGAWLLVAGPVYQAAIELREQEIDRDRISAVSSTVPPLPDVSPWWWLIPPVGYLLHRRRNRQYRRRVMAAMSPDLVQQFAEFSDKAVGWLMVAGGGLLLAVRETSALAVFEGWPLAVWAVVELVMPLAAFSFTVQRMRRHRDLTARPTSDATDTSATVTG